MQLGPNAFADGDGISTERTLRRRWLRQEATILVGFTPLSPREAWPTTYPRTPYNPATVLRLVELFQEALR